MLIGVEMANVVETIQSFMVLETQTSIFASTMVVLGFQAMELVVHEDVQLVVPI